MFPSHVPDVICTHESDLDGLVAGLLLQQLARKRFGANVRLEAYHYQGWQRRNLTERCAWVADLTFESRLDRPGWVVIDHHVTSVQAKQAQLVHDPRKSAALLCYEICRAEGLGSAPLDRLVHLTNVGDLFLVDDPEFELSCDYASLVKTYGFWPLVDLVGGVAERLVDHPLLEVMAVKRRVEDPIGYEWASTHVEEISSEAGLVRTVVGNTNLIVHRLLERQATPFAVLVTLFKKGNGSMVVSFRSRNGEALKMANVLQGGGHPNAAGTTLPQSIRDHESAALYLKQALAPKMPKQTGLNSLEGALSGLKF